MSRYEYVLHRCAYISVAIEADDEDIAENDDNHFQHAAAGDVLHHAREREHRKAERRV